MTAVHATRDHLVSRLPQNLTIAAENTPGLTVVSGAVSALAELEARLADEGTRCQRLPVGYAFHSSMVEPAVRVFAPVARQVSHKRPRTAMISTMTGKLVRQADLDAQYWQRQALSPVLFTEGIQELRRRNCDVFLEIGPGSTLAGLGRACVQDDKAVWAPSLRATRPAQHLDALGALFTAGVNPRWPEYYRGKPRRKVTLSGYPFKPDSYWLPRTIPTSRRAVDVTVSPDIYQIRWRAVPRSDSDDQPKGPRTCVVFGESEAGLGTRLAARLRGQGAEVLLLVPRHGSPHKPLSTFPESPRTDGDVMALLDELTNDGTRHIDLVHCWPHHSPDTSAELEVVRAHAEQAVSRVLTTLRASTGRSGSLRLHLVTVRTQQTDTESVDPLGAVWWGLGRTARIERPDLAVRLVDLGDPADAVELDALATQILAPGHEPDVALRADRRFGPRLVPSPAAGSDDVPRVDGSGCHLVTGGLSGLGLTAAEWLVSRGARHLVLVGRSEPTAEIARRLSTLTARGVRVDVIAADVADPIAMRDLFARFGQGGPRLRGVIHSAGVLRDQLLTDQHWQHFDDVFRTKVYGALLLHEHTRDLDLDFFLLFSSAAAVLGSAGQASYAAGNAFLDALAHHRAALRLPATTVNWGRWADSGMAARLDERDRGRWEARGVAAISPQDGVRALGRVFTSGTPQAVVVSVDWDAYRTAHAKPHLPLLADLDQSVADPRPATPHPRELPAPHDERSLVDLIRAELADVLGYDPAAVRPDSRFDELDIDSLASMELLHRLTAVTGVQLAADTIFEQRDSRALAAYLQGALSGAEPGPQPTVDIAAMFWTGVDSGRFAESHALMHAVAALRPVSDRAELSVVPLNSGSGAHVLLFPPMVALSDPHLYKHLAAAFGDDLAVSALTLPGFLEHEPLVSSRGVLMRLYSEAVIAHVGDSPFVLAGHSSGGTLAYELAQLLQHDAGRSPDGVVLLDAHVATSQVLLDHAKEFYDSIRDRQSTADRLSVARLSAQAWYLEMFREWATLALSCPSLLLRAAQPLRPGAATERSVAPITASDTADVPGDHFTMIEKHASTTARVAREWLDRLLPGNRLN